MNVKSRFLLLSLTLVLMSVALTVRASCRFPATGWSGPISFINDHGAVYPGAEPGRFGNRKPPSVAYATFSPIFHYDEKVRRFLGGNFWDGHATGEKLGLPSADQALVPFLSPVELNNLDKQAVLEQVSNSRYTYYGKTFGVNLSVLPQRQKLKPIMIGLA